MKSGKRKQTTCYEFFRSYLSLSEKTLSLETIFTECSRWLSPSSCWRERVVRGSGTAAGPQGLGPTESWWQIVLWPWAGHCDPTQQTLHHMLHCRCTGTSTWAHLKHRDISIPPKILLSMCLMSILIFGVVFFFFLCVCASILRILQCNLCPCVYALQVLRACPNPAHRFLSITRFSQHRAECPTGAPAAWPVSAHQRSGRVLVPAGNSPCLAQLWPPTPRRSWFQDLPQRWSLNKFKPSGNVGLRDSGLSWKRKCKSESHPGSQREAQQRPRRATAGSDCTAGRICVLPRSPKPCNEAFRAVFVNLSTGTVFMDYLNIKIYGFLEKNHFRL